MRRGCRRCNRLSGWLVLLQGHRTAGSRGSLRKPRVRRIWSVRDASTFRGWCVVSFWVCLSRRQRVFASENPRKGRSFNRVTAPVTRPTLIRGSRSSRFYPRPCCSAAFRRPRHLRETRPDSPKPPASPRFTVPFALNEVSHARQARHCRWSRGRRRLFT
jgi:hypothetical protein